MINVDFKGWLTLLLAFSLHLGAFALPLPKTLLTARLAGAEKGSTCALSDSAGKTLVLLLAGRKSYVVDRRGQIVLRLAQGVNDITEEQLFRATMGAVQRAQGR